MTTSTEQELTKELTVIEKAKALPVISDQLGYDYAANLLTNLIKPFRKKWKEYWYDPKEGPTKIAWDSYQASLRKFNDGDKPAEEAETLVKNRLLVWDTEQRRKHEELQRQAQVAAQKAEEERVLQMAVMAEETGATEEEVAAIVSAPVVAVAAPVEPTYQKAQGISRRENYKARVTDMKKLCAAVAKGQVPVDYVQPNMSALNARAKADKGTLNVPGVQAYDDAVIAGRSR